jgi:predicted nucleotidyltransferase
MFGLRNEDLNSIIAIIAKYEEVEKAYIFGSRAKGNYKNGSDVDIALKGENIPFNTINNISYELNEETIMPYHFDVLNYHTLNNQELISHIDRVGKCFYEKFYGKLSEQESNKLYVGQVSEENNSVYLDISMPDKQNPKKQKDI